MKFTRYVRSTIVLASLVAVVAVVAVVVGTRNSNVSSNGAISPQDQGTAGSRGLTQSHARNSNHPSKTPRAIVPTSPPPSELRPDANGVIWGPMTKTLKWIQPEELSIEKKNAILDQIERRVLELESGQIVRTNSTRTVGKKRPIKTRENSIVRLVEGLNFRAGDSPRKGFETARYFIFSTPNGEDNGCFDSGYAVSKQDAEITSWKLDSPES